MEVSRPTAGACKPWAWLWVSKLKVLLGGEERRRGGPKTLGTPRSGGPKGDPSRESLALETPCGAKNWELEVVRALDRALPDKRMRGRGALECQSRPCPRDTQWVGKGGRAGHVVHSTK